MAGVADQCGPLAALTSRQKKGLQRDQTESTAPPRYQSLHPHTHTQPLWGRANTGAGLGTRATVTASLTGGEQTLQCCACVCVCVCCVCVCVCVCVCIEGLCDSGR